MRRVLQIYDADVLFPTQAANVFYHLTYEGAVDLAAMEDCMERAAIEDQIANFGQTPIQLFRKKHPKRGPAQPIARPLYYAPASITLTSTIPPQSPSPGQKVTKVIFVGLIDGLVVTINKSLSVVVRTWITPALQNFTFSSSQVSVLFNLLGAVFLLLSHFKMEDFMHFLMFHKFLVSFLSIS
jgi:hypothetical protein